MEFKRFLEEGVRGVATIETEKWRPCDDAHGMLRFEGMRTYGEVFRELKTHLEEMGMLPDEYFNGTYSFWHKDKEPMPRFDEAVCYVNFGGNEGIYLDVLLSKAGEKGPTFERFATGKTLDCDVEAYYKMSMICAECSLMLNGRGDRIRLGERDLTIGFKDEVRSLDAALTNAVDRAGTVNSKMDNGSFEMGV